MAEACARCIKEVVVGRWWQGALRASEPPKGSLRTFLSPPHHPGAMMVICSALQFNFFRQHLKYGDKNTYYIIFGKTSKPKEEH